jgi:protein-tyrosine phosphatase
VAAWLLTTRRAATPEEAAAIVRRARPQVVLGSTHLAALGNLR